jgi:hypothetical protein
MTCNKTDCNQGRCDCPRDNDKAVVVAVLFLVLILSMSFGMWKLFNLGKGSPCAVTLQFKDSKATYIGASL